MKNHFRYPMLIRDLKQHFKPDLLKYKISHTDPKLNTNTVFELGDEKNQMVELYQKRFPRSVVDWYDQNFHRHGGRASHTDVRLEKIVPYGGQVELPTAKAFTTLNRLEICCSDPTKY